MKIRVVLADDHKAFREAVRSLLERDRNIDVIGEAGDGNEAMDLVHSAQPDVAVMDIRMPGINGVDLLRQLAAAHPLVKLIILSVTAESIFAAEMLRSGASAYVVKADAEELPRAIDAVMDQRTYLSTEVAGPAAANARASRAGNSRSE